MGKKARDFYHIQDRLPLAWHYADRSGLGNSSDIDAMSKEIEELANRLRDGDPKLRRFIDLTNQKISLLEESNKLRTASAKQAFHVDHKEKNTEVSLSSSGMGFFSENLAEDDAQIDILLSLNTIGVKTRLEATVLECRLSADSENPGYWIRVRFLRDQEQEIDHLLAHVTQRQIEKLQKRDGVSDRSSERASIVTDTLDT